jgi:hypothetical protein
MGGGFRGGMGGGFRGGMGGGFRGGFRGGWGGFHGGWGGFRRFRGFNRRNGFFGLGYYPWGFWPYYSAGWGLPYNDYPYYDSSSNYSYPAYSYPAVSSDYGYASPSPVVIYQSAPAATPQAPAVVVYEVPQQPVPEEIQRNEKPIYLLAFKGQSNIRAAEAYWVAGNTLHYVTLQHQQRQEPLDSVDCALTLQLNHQQGVDIRLSN